MLKPTIILGIDPGFTGAIALYDSESKSLVDVFDMPLHEVKGRKCLDVLALALLVEARAAKTALAIIEDVSAMPGQGVTSMFRFGQAFGIVAGVVSSNMIPIHYAKPAVWKCLMGLNRDKNLSRAKASELFPEKKAHFQRKKDDGRAEAALLALFGERLLPALHIKRYD